MDLKELQNLIRFVSKSEVSEVKLKTKDFEISIKTQQDPNFVPVSAPIAQQLPVQTSTPITTTQENSKVVEAVPSNNSNFITIKSPMIGTFYRKAAPDKPTLANVGDTIAPGKVVCVIEAMKLFNEIESEVSGKIVEILVDDSSPVEFDQPLFVVDPS